MQIEKGMNELAVLVFHKLDLRYSKKIEHIKWLLCKITIIDNPFVTEVMIQLQSCHKFS